MQLLDFRAGPRLTVAFEAVSGHDISSFSTYGDQNLRFIKSIDGYLLYVQCEEIMANQDIIIEILKRIQADTSETRRRVESMEMRMSAQDDHLRGLMTSTVGMQSELQQLNARIDRIERRLDLVVA